MTATPKTDELPRLVRRTVSLLRASGGVLRNLWLMIGVTLILFLGLEGLYRAQAAIRTGRLETAKPVVDSTLHPYAREEWWGPFQGRDGRGGVRHNTFDQYRGYVGTPGSTRYVTIDSAGRRVTPQELPSDRGKLRQVFLLGGSTMWGYTSRDSSTIPAVVARELRDRGVTDVEVVNLAQVGYNSTQDAITLLLELARGRVPAAAVALDGYNDIATAYQHGSAGHTFGEAVVAQQIKRGRRGFWGELSGLGRHSALIVRLREKLGLDRQAPEPRLAPEALCADIARYYRGIVSVTHAMGAELGFPVIHALQPFHSASHKVPTAWERTLGGPRSEGQCARAIESEMAGTDGFVSLTGVFDAETATVFVDQYAHVTEAGDRKIAERIAEFLVPLLTRPGVAATSPER